MAFAEGSGDVIIVFVGDKTALARDGVLLFDGVGWRREGDPVCKENIRIKSLLLVQLLLLLFPIEANIRIMSDREGKVNTSIIYLLNLFADLSTGFSQAPFNMHDTIAMAA